MICSCTVISHKSSSEYHQITFVMVYFHCRDSKSNTGYILGLPIISPAIPERSLSPAACTIIKILMHSALLWTCCSKEVYVLIFVLVQHKVFVHINSFYVQELIKDVSKIVKTGVKSSNLSIFFWEHLTVDMQCLQRSLSIGLDDAALLIHIIMHRIVETFLSTLKLLI